MLRKFDSKDDPSIFEKSTVLNIAKKLGRSPAQVR